MLLWNDYEGRTIAQVYPIGKLIRPEGRNAFFWTATGPNAPAVIRLTEALNDEDEMLTRWQKVAKVEQPNLVALGRCGVTNVEGTPLAYALMEPTEANLADVLKERPLYPAEAMQIGTSVVAALEALHAAKLIHEHIEPVNILAAGEVVKLRSDCVREAPGGAEGAALRQQDVHDLAVALLESLTLQRVLTPAASLPAPFQEVVKNGINGTWGLAEMGAALANAQRGPLVPDSVRPAPLPPSAGVARPRPVVAEGKDGPARGATTATLSAEAEESPLASPRTSLRDLPLRRSVAEPVAEPRFRVAVPLGAAVLLLLLIVWHGVRGQSARPPEAPFRTLAAPAAAATQASSLPVAATPAVTVVEPQTAEPGGRAHTRARRGHHRHRRRR